MFLTKVLSILLCVIMAVATFFFGAFNKDKKPDEPTTTEPTTSQSGDASDDKSWGDIHWNE